MARNSGKPDVLAPDKRPLTELQASRLAKIGRLGKKEAKWVVGKSISEIQDRLKWQLDFQYPLFRRICGQVVKKDPATGEEYPVPFATVHVEDTDCHFLGYFPLEWPWGWYFPYHCIREEIATVQTDACGRFCVYIPKFEIDWILLWRRERICFPYIFDRPTIPEIVEDFDRLEKWLKKIPVPHPPQPWDGVEVLSKLESVEGFLDADVVRDIKDMKAVREFGGQESDCCGARSGPAFSKPLPPPVPHEFRLKLDKDNLNRFAMEQDIEASLFEKNFGLDRYVGPFRKCWDIFIPTWVSLVDVPDITFRVTQDVNGDGTEEVIYSESYFDVRWDSGSIPDVKLVASQIAVAGLNCDAPDVVCETPEIVLAGKMPLHPTSGITYFDAAAGYATRPNRPHPDGDPAGPPLSPAASPLEGTFPFYGCNQFTGAVEYSLAYSFKAPGTGSFTPWATFRDITWKLFRWVGSPGHLEFLDVAPDTGGWYKILNPADGWLPARLLLNWPTNKFQSGLYKVKLQLRNASKTMIHETAPLNFRIDNSAPVSQFTRLRWRRANPAGDWIDLPLICPVVERGPQEDIEFEVSYLATAAHLRSLILSGGGCGGGAMVRTSIKQTAQYWHRNHLDNSVVNAATFGLSHSLPDGGYAFNLWVSSRAFNPDDNNGHLADWLYNPVFIRVNRELRVAVVRK